MFCSSSTNLSSMYAIVILRWGILLSPSGVVFISFLESWMSVGQLFELFRTGTCSYPDFVGIVKRPFPSLGVGNPSVATFDSLQQLFVYCQVLELFS